MESTKGRPRKADDDQIVSLYNKQIYAAVVGYRADPSPRYLVVRCDPLGRAPYGQAIWVESTEFEATDRHSRTPGVYYRGNQKLEVVWGERPCNCQCCVH